MRPGLLNVICRLSWHRFRPDPTKDWNGWAKGRIQARTCPDCGYAELHAPVYDGIGLRMQDKLAGYQWADASRFVPVAAPIRRLEVAST